MIEKHLEKSVKIQISGVFTGKKNNEPCHLVRLDDTQNPEYNDPTD